MEAHRLTFTPPLLPEGFVPDPRTFRTPMAEALLREVFHPDGARIVSIWGGIGGGKSYAIAQLIFAVAQARPGCRILVGAGSLNLLLGVVKLRCDEVFGADGLASWCGGILDPHFAFPNGSVAQFRAYKLPKTRSEAENPWEGRDCHLLVIDEIEQLPETVLDHSLQRCRISATDVAGNRFSPTVVWCGRPGAIDHWVRETLALGNKGERVKIIYPQTRDNPLLWERGPDGAPFSPYLDRLRAKHTREQFECLTQEVVGATMPSDGAIFDGVFIPLEWPAGNLVRCAPDPASTTWACIDFGVSTMAVLWIQRRMVGGQLADVVVDEWCPDTATSTQRVVEELLSPSRPRANELCVDPAGQARNPTSRLVSEVDILRRAVGADPDGLGGGVGIPVRARTLQGERGRVRAGVARVSARFCTAAGERQLLVALQLWESPRHRRGMRHTIQQYEWGPDGEPLKGERGRHADHVADALRQHVARNAWQGLQMEAPRARQGRGGPAPRSAGVRRRGRGRQSGR